jgi:single-stranded-DNA-specific exonuclease
MGKTLGVSETLAILLANRGLRSKRAAFRYLRPDMRYLGDIHLMKDLDGACAMILDSVSQREKITVYGDYDVDGVTSTVIMIKALRRLGADARFYIPRREEEGYGLNLEAVRKIHEAKADLLITCDNGVAALEEIGEARRLGMKVIVLDHHEPGFVEDEQGRKRDVTPSADLVIDPKQKSCAYPFKQLCAAGLAYRCAEALYALAGLDFQDMDEFLALAAIATICDMVPLLEENRILAKRGLEILNQNRQVNLGLWHLMKEKHIQDKNINVFDIGFIVGPCVNASGRLGHAADAVDLFLTDDAAEAEHLAAALVELNEDRKKMTALALEQSLEHLEDLDKVMVLYEEEIHESIAGIVAGRLKEIFSHPVILLTKGAEHAKGSARSIENYNLFEELYKNRDLFIRFGGHAMAAGMTLKKENIELLRKRLNESCCLKDEDFNPIYHIDRQIQPEQITFALAQELDLLAPFGKDNPEPLFGAKALRLEHLRMIDEKNTMIFTIPVEDTPRKIKAICFGLNSKWKEEIRKLYAEYDCEKIFAGVLRTARFLMDVVYALEINEYNNNYSIQMRIKDFRVYQDNGSST